MMPTIRLLARADDLGSFSGVTPSVLYARRHGIVRNASVMVPTRWFADTAQQLRGRKDLCIGVHLTVCCEWTLDRWAPVLPTNKVPCLVDASGAYKRDPGTIHEAGVDAEQILAECTAQVQRAREAGLEVSYVDTHMGWEWIHAANGPRLSELLPTWAKAMGVRWYQHANINRLRGVSGHSTRERILSGFDNATSGTYLVVGHPCWASNGIANAHLGRDKAEGSVQHERIGDAQFLADATLARELERRGVELVRYDQVIA
jgi:chitin disaccharide deacetylase